MPRLRLRLGRAAREASARRPRTRPDQQSAAQALRPGIDCRELRRRSDERDYSRHERRDCARRHDDQSTKFKTADSKIRTYEIVVANPIWNQPFNPDIFADDPFD